MLRNGIKDSVTRTRHSRRLTTPQVRRHSHHNSPLISSNASIPLTVHPEVADALRSGKAIVALESAIITHGMPNPLNYQTALQCEQIIRSTGAIPATIGMLSGQIHIGLEASQIGRLADEANKNKVKLSRRDLAPAIAKKLDGGTTIAGTMILAHLAGIKVFSTGGLGGVHRGGENSLDISADLTELGRTPVAVVSAGAKSILDIGRTLEYLETQGVTVTTYGPSRDFPAFFSRQSGFQSSYSIESPHLAAAMLYASNELNLQSGALIAVPIPAEYEAEGLIIQEAVNQAVRESEENGISKQGKDVTPWLLKRVMELTGGKSLKNNVALIENTSLIGGQIAVEYSKLVSGSSSSPSNYQPSIPSTNNPTSLTTSAVSISSSTQLGSNVSNAPADLIVVGAAAVDVIAQASPTPASSQGSSTSSLITNSTVPGSVRSSLGGVGRNVAEAAHRTIDSLSSTNEASNSATLLVAPIGDDAFGDLIRSETARMGMRIDGLNTAATINDGSKDTVLKRRTPVCNMILTGDGDLFGGVADFSALDTLEAKEAVKFIRKHKPKVLALDGNIPEDVMTDIALEARASGIPIWFEPTSKAKSTRILSAIRSYLEAPATDSSTAPITYFSPNTYELEHVFNATRQSSISKGRELPSLVTYDYWFQKIDEMGLKAGISSDDFARLGGSEGAWLAKEGIIQMSVQLLPFFQHIVVKCGERGAFVAMQIPKTDQEDWVAAASVPPHLNRPIVVPSPYPGITSQLVVQWFPSHTLTQPVMNVTGAGDSLVGSLLGSLVMSREGGKRESTIFDHPAYLKEAMDRAQNAAVLSLFSESATSPAISSVRSRA